MDFSKRQPCQIVLIIVYVILIECWQPFTLTNRMKAMASVVTCKFGVSLLFLLCTLTNTAVCQYPCIKTQNECGCVFKNAKNEPMLISLSDLDYKSGTAYL